MSCASTPSVSVIIPTIDGASLLPGCLGALYGQNVDVELIIVDNGSKDGSIERLRAELPGATIVQNSGNLGFAKACNQGVEVATAPFVLLLNNDVRLDAGCLEGLVRVLERDAGIAACQPTLVDAKSGTLDSAGSDFTVTGFLHHLSEPEVLGEASSVVRRFSLKGACMLIRRDRWRAVGGLDESYFAYFEESDLCWRFQLRGWNVCHAKTLSAQHVGGATTTRLFASSYIDFLSFRNRLTTIRKNSSLRLEAIVLPLHIACCLGMCVAFVVSGKPRNALAIIRALGWHATHRRRSFAGTRPQRAAERRVLCAVSRPVEVSGAIRQLRAYLRRW